MTTDSMRLHITPLTPDLLHAVVGPKLLDSVSNVSYHTIQTFPENDYGYLDLPAMEAEKIKKKFNGAILKGKKIKIEEARPKKRRRDEETTEEPVKEEPVRKAKKSKKEPNVIEGYELPADRKVKRGWTESKPSKASKKSKGKTSVTSKFSDKDELLFRTNLPPNKQDGLKPERKDKTKTKRKNGEHVVHEFEKSTTQPSFLRQDVGLGIKGNLEFVAGQGWVDAAGQVVEAESEGVLRQRHVLQTALKDRQKKIAHDESSSDSSISESDVESTSGDDENEEQRNVQDNDETSSSGTSSESESDAESDTSASDEEASSASLRSVNEEDTQMHPLEAIFKKPRQPASQDLAKPSLEVSTSFSFFEPEDHDDIEEEPTIPLTPFSSQDFRARGLRSAAPTPDSAHPSRFNSYSSSKPPSDDEDKQDGKAAPPERRRTTELHSETPSKKQSEFEKKFWENRGDNNRSWKMRRRTVLKEKRQRENKARRPKNW
ncbi:hypothetical protein LTR72_003998 [Exophiala xenobiotica]|nr:hypothetical protein LTR72_003998 [Exophiala xenobiotica]KAK5298915.1 hypothetical protein LTR14_002767 [Exophiala xenobiotica]KAK5494313.1 hypothetical protein LTR55_002699 [Exophiala xenobiotica]